MKKQTSDFLKEILWILAGIVSVLLFLTGIDNLKYYMKTEREVTVDIQTSPDGIHTVRLNAIGREDGQDHGLFEPPGSLYGSGRITLYENNDTIAGYYVETEIDIDQETLVKENWTVEWQEDKVRICLYSFDNETGKMRTEPSSIREIYYDGTITTTDGYVIRKGE